MAQSLAVSSSPGHAGSLSGRKWKGFQQPADYTPVLAFRQSFILRQLNRLYPQTMCRRWIFTKKTLIMHHIRMYQVKFFTLIKCYSCIHVIPKLCKAAVKTKTWTKLQKDYMVSLTLSSRPLAYDLFGDWLAVQLIRFHWTNGNR